MSLPVAERSSHAPPRTRPYVLKAERWLAVYASLQRFDMHAQTFRPVRMLLHQGAQHLEHVWHGQAAEMLFSVSTMRSSPEISLGRSVSRSVASALTCCMSSAMRSSSGSTDLWNALTIVDAGLMKLILSSCFLLIAPKTVPSSLNDEIAGCKTCIA